MYSRRLLINSANNMRELGGYPALDGRTTAYGVFIRSDLPDELTERDLQFLVRYGVKNIVDMRCGFEIEERPGSLRDSGLFNWKNISFTEDFTYFGGLTYCPKTHLVPTMERKTRFAEIMEYFSELQGGTIFHCTAGKDRTGVIAAALLLLAGVPREDVIADYEVTYIYIRRVLEKRMSSDKRPPELCRTDPEWIEPLLDYFDEKGGVENYLLEKNVKPEIIGKLKNKIFGARNL